MNTANNTQTVSTFFNPRQKDWSSATISIGTYGTRRYSEKTFKRKSSLMKALIDRKYPNYHPFSGDTWNNNGIEYKIEFDYIG